MVKVITDLTDIPQDVNVLIDFFADWCGPCKRVAPVFAELSEKYTDIVFLKVNVDDSEEIAQAFKITSLPTFLFLNKGNIYKKIEGADINSIISTIENLILLK
jgi:thioredoxin 1